MQKIFNFSSVGAIVSLMLTSISNEFYVLFAALSTLSLFNYWRLR